MKNFRSVFLLIALLMVISASAYAKPLGKRDSIYLTFDAWDSWNEMYSPSVEIIKGPAIPGSLEQVVKLYVLFNRDGMVIATPRFSGEVSGAKVDFSSKNGVYALKITAPQMQCFIRGKHKVPCQAIYTIQLPASAGMSNEEYTFDPGKVLMNFYNLPLSSSIFHIDFKCPASKKRCSLPKTFVYGEGSSEANLWYDVK